MIDDVWSSPALKKPVQYVIRNYQKGDEIEIVRILSECFEPTTVSSYMRWKRRAERKPEEIFVATVDQKPISHVDVGGKQLHLGEGVYSKTAAIGGVCTDSDYRNKGIVTHLLKLSLERAQQSGVSNASLFTGLDLRARRIYQRLGFVDVMTWRNYMQYTDYTFLFARWVRRLNKSLKGSKIAAERLRGWDKSVVIQLKDVGALSFRFRNGRFQKLKAPSRSADIEFSTDLQTYVKVRRGVLPWQQAIESGKLRVKRGEAADFGMLERIWAWRWDD